MRANGFGEDFTEVFAGFDTLMDRALTLDAEVLTTPECLAMLEHWEVLHRRFSAVAHPMINQLAAYADEAELGEKLLSALANRLRVTRAEASRRIGDAADLGPRRALTGEPLELILPATAAAQRAGLIGDAHIRVIRGFWQRLPEVVDIETRVTAEARLAELGTAHRPDELSKLADRLAYCLNPDGNFSDVDRARRRSLIVGKQDVDGMSPIRGYLTPEARATLDAVFARWAAPGMCDAEDDTPCVSGTPSQDVIQSDTRSAGQRHHDALTALGRAMLASGDLGQHNGLPASIIVTTTLAELEAAAGTALTGGGTLLPMSDVIRLVSHARHYLAIFDKGKTLALYHTKRIASPAQRIVLYAKDRGCSHPGCDVPGYLTEVHHVTGFAVTNDTDINDLTLRCGPHHKLVQPGGWTTRKNKHGTTQSIPPPHLDHGQPRTNSYHHPEKLLAENNDEDKDDGEDP